MKDVQQLGGDTEIESARIGLSRQLTIDDDNHRIHLHDGVTPGGHIFRPSDENDTRYQEKNEELNNWSFTVGARGFLARTGVGTYALRQVKGTANQINVVNPAGVEGDTTISLPDEINKSITWTGTHTFTEVVTGLGWQGDTMGDHTGGVQGDVIGNVTGNLTGDSEGTHTGPHIGPVDARGEQVQFSDESIPQSAVEGLQDALGSIPGALPTGIVCAWYGTLGNVPAGWLLCDGQNGTPDLRERFIMGGGGDFAVHTTGGVETFTPAGTIAAGGTHNHTGTVAGTAITIAQMPAHAHLNGVTDNIATLFNHGSAAANPTTAQSIESGGSTGTLEGNTTSVGGGQSHTHGLTIDNGGNHTHAFAGTAGDARPPFYVLAFIMKA